MTGMGIRLPLVTTSACALLAACGTTSVEQRRSAIQSYLKLGYLGDGPVLNVEVGVFHQAGAEGLCFGELVVVATDSAGKFEIPSILQAASCAPPW